MKKVAEGGPLPEDQYSKLKSHQQALGFWEEAALAGIDHMHWHFPPKEFIRFFRKCGWLTKSDMKGIYPAASDANVSKYIIHINKTLSKYLIVGGLRRSHFLDRRVSNRISSYPCPSFTMVMIRMNILDDMQMRQITMAG